MEEVAAYLISHPGWTVVRVVQDGCDGDLCQGVGLRDEWGARSWTRNPRGDDKAVVVNGAYVDGPLMKQVGANKRE